MKDQGIKYHIPRKLLEIYAETEEENRAAICELDKQLTRMKAEFLKTSQGDDEG